MIDLYSSATPNGRKVTIMLEELGIKYNTITINLDKKEQFSEQFSKISPSNKIPVIVDKENKQTIFESGAILLYLAKKYNKFLTNENYWDVVQWLFFQMAYVGPMLGQAHQYLFYHPGKSEFAEKKSDILRYYSTYAPFGGNVVGLNTASWRYYRKPAYQLTWAQSATLAVLPNAPSLIFPGKNHNLLLKKRNK